jgi:hypothetical protein
MFTHGESALITPRRGPRHTGETLVQFPTGNESMQYACYDATVPGKKTDVQLRGVPLVLRERLRKRADSKGLSMSQYVIEMLTDDLARPSLAEWLAEVGKSPAIDLAGKTGADLVREGRRELGLED